MFAAIGLWAGGAWNWFIKSPVAQGAAFVIGLLFAWTVVKGRLKAEGAREQERIHNEANLKEQAEMADVRREITDDLAKRSHEADAAVARLPQLRSTDELRKLDPELAALVLGPDQGHGR